MRMFIVMKVGEFITIPFISLHDQSFKTIKLKLANFHPLSRRHFCLLLRVEYPSKVYALATIRDNGARLPQIGSLRVPARLGRQFSSVFLYTLLKACHQQHHLIWPSRPASVRRGSVSSSRSAQIKTADVFPSAKLSNMSVMTHYIFWSYDL